MNRNILLLSVLLVSLSCKKENVSEFVTLSGIANTIIQDTIYLETNNRLQLTSQKKLKYNLKVGSGNKFNDTLNIPKGYYKLFIDNKMIPLFLEPGFNLNIDLKNPKVRISGIGAVENMYLQSKQELDSRLTSINWYHYFQYLEEKEFLTFADSIKNLRDNLINSYDLPNEEFKFLEESYSKIDRTNKFLNYPASRKLNDTNYIQSKEYPDYFKDINRNDDRLIEIPLFNLSLYNEVFQNNNTKNGNSNDRGFRDLKFAIIHNNQITNNKVKEQLVFTIADIAMEHSDSLDLFYKTYIGFSKNENNIKKISTKYYRLKGYKKGDILPDFKLYNDNDELVSLENLKGKILFIDIWATWCKPCIEEIKPSNRLQKKLSKQNITFISICINSKKDSWLKVINENDFNGVHLFCPEAKINTFKEDYLIESLPRYIILDEKGRIFDLNAKKPSNKELELELIEISKGTYANNV